MSARWWGGLALLALMLAGGAGQAEEADDCPTAECCDVTKDIENARPAACEGATGGITDSDATEQQERKQYIEQVLSRSGAGPSKIDLRGKQLARTGSGFFVAADGTLVTSYRSIDGCALISVSPTFGEMVAAMPVGTDPEGDLALLRADVPPPGIASFTGSRSALTGEPTYVIGYHRLGVVTDEPTLTTVRILGSQKTVFSLSTIIIEGAIRSGDTGGALLDSSGGVIGIVSASASQTYAATGRAPQDVVGLALPNETLQQFLRKNGIEDRDGLKLPPKSRSRILIDARAFMAQIGCWQ